MKKIILAIETSCDETAISLIQEEKEKIKILANLVSSQVKVHAPFGGVVPHLAKREHEKNLIPILKLALKEAKKLKKQPFPSKISLKEKRILEKIFLREKILLKKLLHFLKNYQKPKINYLAVTYGPGLAPALWPGVNLARALSFYWKIPLIPINHLEAHIYANLLTRKKEEIKFPAIALIISGGHTQLIYMKNFGHYKLIGETRDDAVGECFDKVARLLGLGYPGGPAIAQEALKTQGKKSPIEIKLPRPMINSHDFDFSFAGLKTAVLYLLEDFSRKGIDYSFLIPFIAQEFQEAVVEVLIKKTILASQKFKVKTIMIGGGVAANQVLQENFRKILEEKQLNYQLIFPEKQFSTDNAAMVGLTAYYHLPLEKKIKWQELEADPNLQL